MKLSVVGATGLVGQTMLKVLEQTSFPCTSLLAVASASSVGKEVLFKGKAIKIISIEDAIDQKPDLALFSAGSEVSRQWAPLFAAHKTIVIDNSAAWRLQPDIPLVVPEVNPEALHKGSLIIANPNCSTIQLVLALASVHKHFKIKRLVVSTYQSVTGSGYKGINQLEQEQQNKAVENPAYPHPIHLNLIPHGGAFDDAFYTAEERKLEVETRKILSSPEIAITATVVRVPVVGGHSMAVNIETEKPFEMEEIRQLLANSPGIKMEDIPDANIYPMPLYAQGKDDVFVGRVRRDATIANGLNMWIVADNLRKGAATNAVQIANYLLQNNLLAR
jgi:aspartate-semialdehyde dehydrogenase